jgi:hypothetical protein
MADNLTDWRVLNTPLEGRVNCMYLDKKGLVTCGVGNLIDPVELATRLQWRHGENGPLADAQTIRDVWLVTKRHGNPDRLWTTYARELSDLRLSEQTIDALVDDRLLANEAFLVANHVPFDEWREYPADAQMAILSIAWACGADYPKEWPNFWRAVRARDWMLARAHCTIREAGNPGVIPRNEANRVMLANAAVVDEMGLDPDHLHWPRVIGRPAQTEPAQAPAELIPLQLPDGWLNDLRKDWLLHENGK